MAVPARGDCRGGLPGGTTTRRAVLHDVGALRAESKPADEAKARSVCGDRTDDRTLAVLLGGKAGEQFMMPGKLSSPHAGLTNCSACHAGARSGQVDLLHRLFTAVEPRQNSNLCVTCHVMGSEPFAPHTHSVEDLRRVTELLRRDSKNAPSETLMQRIAFPGTARSQRAEAEIQCATCHKEHQGVFADLKTVSNQRCQTCHVSRFGSFAYSHPQFANFPYRRRPRIIFDHQSHMTKHFPEVAKAAAAGQVVPDSCTDCHQPGVRRRYMEVKSFATMCSSCHNGDITGATQVSGPKGIDVITVPGLDLATLNERGIDIGGWPKESEAELTPFMGLLLESKNEPVVSDVKGLNLLDLRRASDQDLARVARLAWAVKRLFKQLETTNPAARMLASDAAGSPVDRGRVAALTGAMSNDVILSGSREWFPNLHDDLEQHDRGDPTQGFKPQEKEPAAAEKTSQPASGGDSAAAPTKMPDASSSNDILSPDSGADGNKADILAPSNNAKVPNPSGKEDILAPSNKADILTPGTKDDILNPNNKDDILSADKATGDNSLSGAGGNAALAAPEPKGAATNAEVAAKKSADANPAPFDPEVWGQAGGWYREDFAIRYRPTGHADQFLQTWLDFAGQAYGTSRLRDQMNLVFDVLAPKDAIGRCTKCHSVDDQAGARIVNWQPFNPNAINNRFTNYSHKPHVELIGAATCVKCHQLREGDVGFLKTYEGGDPANYTPNFKYIEKSVCSACHSQQAEWENCTVCHGYHVPDANSSSASAVLPVALAAGPEASPLASDGNARRDYDLAVQQMAKQGATAPEKSATVVPAVSPPTAPGNSATATPDNSAPPTPAKSASDGTTEPTDPDSFYQRGHQRAVGGDLELAIQDFSEVIRRDPSHAAALNDRCWTRALLDELQAALDDCNMSLKVQPSFPDALDSRGLVNLKLGLYKKAIGDYTAALLYNPKRASALYGRGIAEQRIGDAAHAKSDIAAAKSIQATVVDEFAGYGVQ